MGRLNARRPWTRWLPSGNLPIFLLLPHRRMHEAGGLISIEGSLEGLTKEESLPDKRPAVMPEDAVAAKSAKKKAKKAARAKKANGDL